MRAQELALMRTEKHTKSLLVSNSGGFDTNPTFTINGCIVSISSAPECTDKPIIAVKEILLSAYRTRVRSN